jgi:hypothetical protein
VKSQATTPVLRRGYPDKCGGCGADSIEKGRERERKEENISEEAQWRPTGQEKHISNVPSAERPVVPVHWVGQLARFCARQRVAHEAFRVESESMEQRTSLSATIFETKSEGD